MKNNQIIPGTYYGHEVKITITEIDPPIKLDIGQDIPQCIKNRLFELLEENITDNDFSKHPITGKVYSQGEEIEVTMKGSWRVIPDYSFFTQIAKWEYEHSKEEKLSMKLFIKYFGKEGGKFYFGKWTVCSKVLPMINSFKYNEYHRNIFYNMLREQVNKFIARTNIN